MSYWFNNNVNIGDGIRAMLVARMHQAKNVTLLERTNINDVMTEQDFGASNRVRKGSQARIGNISGADCLLYGDIVIFGRDDTTKRKRLAGFIQPFSPLGAVVATLNKAEKAVVGITLRIVDAETGDVLETAEARGESSRSSKDYAGLLGVKGAAVGAGSSMTSSNFEQTIIGEATSNAVNNIVQILETRIPQFPAKARNLDGRVARIDASNVTLNIGSQDSVIVGDRFEILHIKREILDPTTKDVLDVDAVKVGELVVGNVREKTASGTYGGQALSALQLTGQGYAARLMTK